MTCEPVYPMQHTQMRHTLTLDSIEIIYLYQAVNPNAFLWTPHQEPTTEAIVHYKTSSCANPVDYRQVF